MTRASDENRLIARTVARAFGAKQPKIFAYWDDNDESCVDILCAVDCPQRGVTSYSTVNLSNAPLLRDGEEYDVRLEIVGACGDAYHMFANALATAAFNIINSQWFCYPGAVFPDVVSMYEASSTMAHFLFVPPFLWEDKLQTLYLKTKNVAWLHAVPISEAELNYAEIEGVDKLQDAFVEHQIDIYNLERPSIF